MLQKFVTGLQNVFKSPIKLNKFYTAVEKKIAGQAAERPLQAVDIQNVSGLRVGSIYYQTIFLVPIGTPKYSYDNKNEY